MPTDHHEGGVVLDVADLDTGSYGVTPALSQVFREAAEVCLAHNEHAHPVVPFTVTDDENTSTQVGLTWNQPSHQARRAYADPTEAVELGACGLALLVMRGIKGYTAIERSCIGSGFDFWLGRDESPPLFGGKARLEISGLLKGSGSQERARSSAKVKQMANGKVDGGTKAPGYAAVVNFGPPSSKISFSGEQD